MGSPAEFDVVEATRRWLGGETIYAMAPQYGVTPSVLYRRMVSGPRKPSLIGGADVRRLLDDADREQVHLTRRDVAEALTDLYGKKITYENVVYWLGKYHLLSRLAVGAPLPNGCPRPPQLVLTPRQREWLQRAYRSKSVADIADAIGVSAYAAHRRLHLAGVTTDRRYRASRDDPGLGPYPADTVAHGARPLTGGSERA